MSRVHQILQASEEAITSSPLRGKAKKTEIVQEKCVDFGDAIHNISSNDLAALTGSSKNTVFFRKSVAGKEAIKKKTQKALEAQIANEKREQETKEAKLRASIAGSSKILNSMKRDKDPSGTPRKAIDQHVARMRSKGSKGGKGGKGGKGARKGGKSGKGGRKAKPAENGERQ